MTRQQRRWLREHDRVVTAVYEGLVTAEETELRLFACHLFLGWPLDQCASLLLLRHRLSQASA